MDKPLLFIVLFLSTYSNAGIFETASDFHQTFCKVTEGRKFNLGFSTLDGDFKHLWADTRGATKFKSNSKSYGKWAKNSSEVNEIFFLLESEGSSVGILGLKAGQNNKTYEFGVINLECWNNLKSSLKDNFSFKEIID